MAVFARGRHAVGALWYKVPLPRVAALLLLAVLAVLAVFLRLAAPPTTDHPMPIATSPGGATVGVPPRERPTPSQVPASSVSEALEDRYQCVSEPLPVVTLPCAGDRCGTRELLFGGMALCVVVDADG